MLFVNFFALLSFALEAAAKSTMVARDGVSVVKAMEEVLALTNKLDQIVKNFNGDAQPLNDASKKLLTSINEGIVVVKASGMLDMGESANVAGPTMTLSTSVVNTVNDLIAKKQALAQAGQGALVYRSLQDQKAGAVALSQAIISRVHPQTAPLGDTLTKEMIAALQTGIDAFKDVATAPVPTAPAAIIPPTPPTAAPTPTTTGTPVVIFDPVTTGTPSSASTSTAAHSKSTGAYDIPTAPSKASSHGYDGPPSSSSKSAPGYGYDTSSAPASKPTKSASISAPGYGYDTPSAPASKATSKATPGYGYDTPSASAAPKPTKSAPGYDSPSSPGYGYDAPSYDAPTKSKTTLAHVSATKAAPHAKYTGAAALNCVSGRLAFLAAAILVL